MKGGEAADHSYIWKALAGFPRIQLAQLPTPLLPLRRLGQKLGIDLWLKRDDLISFGFGGNKVRGLELLVADALAQGSDTLVTGAGVQSNHVRATAAAAAFCDLKCVAVFWGSEPDRIDGNYRLTRMLGANCVFTGDADRASVDQGIAAVCSNLRKRGHKPYPIPRGGACPLGTLGHVLAAKELADQCQSQGITPDTVVLAAGSGGTHAGWLLGSRLLGSPWAVESYTVSREVQAAREQVSRLATEAAVLLNLDSLFTPDQASVHDGFIGPGYGLPSPEGTEALRLLAQTEGVLLDPTYTGKAMAGFLDKVWNAPRSGRCVVFLHTGGEPAFFSGDGEWLRRPDHV